MRLVSYTARDGVRLGALVDGGVIDLDDAVRDASGPESRDMVGFIELGAEGLDRAEAAIRGVRPMPLQPGQLRPPISRPRRDLFAVGRNYAEHVAEARRAGVRGVEVPANVVFFSKLPSTVVPDEANVELDPKATSKLDYEVELVVVIGRRGRNIPVADAIDHVYGYTIANDISARDAQSNHVQWFKGKNMDTFCPLGPCIVPARDFGDPQRKWIGLRVNGEVRQAATTGDMIFDVPTIVHQLSIGLTLEPGDMILTGTPAGVALGMTPQVWLQPGDLVEAEIEGIGVLRNTIVLRNEATVSGP